MVPFNNNIANISFIKNDLDFTIKFYDYEFNVPIYKLRSGNIEFINNKEIMVSKNYTKVIGSITDLITILIVCRFNKKKISYFIEICCDNTKSYIKTL